MTDSQILEKQAQRRAKKEAGERAEADRSTNQAKEAADKEILRRVLGIAIGNGWDYLSDVKFGVLGIGGVGRVSRIDGMLNSDPSTYIYRHDFAKALWGEHTETMTVQNNTLNVTQVIDMDGWRYHLQQMVIANSPIKYLGENA